MMGDTSIISAGAGGYRVDTETQREEQLVDLGALGDIRLRERGMVADAMGTTALSFDDRYWALRFSIDGRAHLAVIDVSSGDCEIILAAGYHRASDVLPG